MDPLAELEALGLTDGVRTTLTGNGVRVEAGDLSSSTQFNDSLDPGEQLMEATGRAFESLLGKITALPEADRPTAVEATTRMVYDYVIHEERPPDPDKGEI